MAEKPLEHPPFLTHPLFGGDGMRYGFFTREGGVSTGPFASLNCGENSKDSIENIDENFRRIADAMGVQPSHLISCGQIHSSTVVTVTKPWPRAQRPKA